MSLRKLNFRGFMAPVFTPFNNDERQTVNFDMVDKYAKYLKNSNIHGVLVNGSTGEGMSLSLEERKKVAEKWSKACKENEITLMVEIGGTALTNVIDLAIHANELAVDAVLCLPELYYRPANEEALVEYLKIVSKYCPNTPLLYYHIPVRSNVNFYMPKLIKLATEAIPNFVGIKYTSTNLDEGVACNKTGTKIFHGAHTIVCGAYALGLDSSIISTLNICPELSLKIVDLMRSNRLEDARNVQLECNERIENISSKGEWIAEMKREFNHINKEIGLNVGVPRKPL